MLGTTPKPLKILVDPKLRFWPEVQGLEEQGHTVHEFRDLDLDYDIILAPSAHRMDDSLRKWLPEAIAEARRRKYPSKKGQG